MSGLPAQLWLLLRCRSPPRRRQNDQASVVSATLYETGLFGVAERLLKLRIRKTDVRSAPRVRAVDAEAVELGDERRRALKTVSGDHLPTPFARKPRGEGVRKTAITDRIAGPSYA